MPILSTLAAAATKAFGFGYKVSSGGASNVYPTWNPNDKGTYAVLSNGNLALSASATAPATARASLAKVSGVWYWELTIVADPGGTWVGIADTTIGMGQSIGLYANSVAYRPSTGQIYGNSGLLTTAGTVSAGGVVGILLNMNTRTIAWYSSGGLLYSTTLSAAGVSGTAFYPAGTVVGTAYTLTANFGATAFALTPPAGANLGIFYTANTDPYWLNTTLLMQFEGSNGGTVMTDAKGHAFTAQNGNAATSTTTPLLGAASLLLASSSWIDTPGTSFVNDITSFGAGDFTIEWMHKTSTTNTYVFGQANSGLSVGTLNVTVTAGGKLSIHNATTSIVTGSVTVSDGSTHKCAVVRFGGTIYLFVDGTLDTSASYSTSIANAGAYHFSIGRCGDYAGGYFVGEIDEFRITNGVGRYLGSYVPQTTNSPLLGGPFAFPTFATSPLGANQVLSNGNLTVGASSGGAGFARTTMAKGNGRWYWEFTNTTTAGSTQFGIANISESVASGLGQVAGGNSIAYYPSGAVAVSGSVISTGNPTVATGGIVGIALDLWASTLAFYVNGTLAYSTTFSAAGLTASAQWFAAAGVYTVGGLVTLNAGTTAFSYTPPTGFIGLQG